MAAAACDGDGTVEDLDSEAAMTIGAHVGDTQYGITERWSSCWWVTCLSMEGTIVGGIVAGGVAITIMVKKYLRVLVLLCFVLWLVEEGWVWVELAVCWCLLISYVLLLITNEQIQIQISFFILNKMMCLSVCLSLSNLWLHQITDAEKRLKK